MCSRGDNLSASFYRLQKYAVCLTYNMYSWQCQEFAQTHVPSSGAKNMFFHIISNGIYFCEAWVAVNSSPVLVIDLFIS